MPVVAINKPDFLAGYSLFYESARYGGDFMAAIENNLDFSLSHFSLSPKYLTSDAYITKKRPAFADLLSAGSLTIIEAYPTISRSSQTSYIGMNRCSTASPL